jgi:hypothetical protein
MHVWISPHGESEAGSLKVEFPIFVLAKDCGDILKFNSIREMERELEQIDIDNNEYEAWDKNGAPLGLSVQQPGWLRIEVSSQSSQNERLTALIKQFAARQGAGELPNLADPVALFNETAKRLSKHR